MNGYDLTASLFASFVSLGWPIALIIGVYLFKEKLQEILPRLQFKHKETEFSFQQNQPAKPDQPALSGLEDPHPLETVNSVLSTIQKDLEKVQEDQRIPALTRALALAQVGVNFEFIFSLIFQSQIDFLRVLERIDLSIEDAQKFFDEHPNLTSDMFRDAGYSKWSEFLVSQGLIVSQYKASITQKGRDFLRFVDVEKPGFAKGN